MHAEVKGVCFLRKEEKRCYVIPALWVFLLQHGSTLCFKCARGRYRTAPCILPIARVFPFTKFSEALLIEILT